MRFMLKLDAATLPNGLADLRLERTLPAGIQAYAALRHAIVTLKLRPGQSFSEQEVAQQLRTSRTPVREAFIKLAEAGLIEVLPQRGTFVRKISLKAVKDARFVREAIELAVLREAIGQSGRRLLRHDARSCIAAQREAAASDDLERFLALDDAFHRSFADDGRPQPCLDGGRGAEDADGPGALPEPARRHADRPADRPARSDPRRRRARGSAAAEAAMRTHLTEVLAALEPLRQRHPDLFEPDER